MIELQVLKLRESAKLPTKAYPGDAGWDLYADGIHSIGNGKIQSEEVGQQPIIITFKTGISLAIPEGYFGLVCDRSSMGSKGIKVYGGVIDSGYRGEVLVMLSIDVHEARRLVLNKQKIAQLLVLPVLDVEIKEVKSLSSTVRGEKGFGSSS